MVRIALRTFISYIMIFVLASISFPPVKMGNCHRAVADGDLRRANVRAVYLTSKMPVFITCRIMVGYRRIMIVRTIRRIRASPAQAHKYIILSLNWPYLFATLRSS